MKKYQDYKAEKPSNVKKTKRKADVVLTQDELSKIRWTRFKIIVETEEDRQEIMEAFCHFHYADIDTDFITVNQLAHQYLEPNNIIVDPALYKELSKD